MSLFVVICSMLHESESQNSATRMFRSAPVLDWTLHRLTRTQQIANIACICWDDQLDAVRPVAERHGAHVLCKSPRIPLPQTEALKIAGNWTDGWRGGLLQSCAFDQGWHGPWVLEAMERLGATGVVLVDPSSGLVDPAIIDSLVEHAGRVESKEMLFTQAPPGIGGVLLRESLVRRLSSTGLHPGKLLHYLPDVPQREPIGTEACVPIPTRVARSPLRYTINSERQVKRLTRALEPLNGQLIGTGAEEIVVRAERDDLEPYPREITVEWTTERATRPIFLPRDAFDCRPPMTAAIFERILQYASTIEDVRLNIEGLGDPLLHPELPTMLAMLKDSGIRGANLMTDLLPASRERLDLLIENRVGVVSVLIPGTSEATYASVMGVNRLREVLENLRTLAMGRVPRGTNLPILAPTFVKCRQNVMEMEDWYDHWLRGVGSAVIVGPDRFGSTGAAHAVARMAPTKRKPCTRAQQSMTFLADGTAVSCGVDLLGTDPFGMVANVEPLKVWTEPSLELRNLHRCGGWDERPLCSGCQSWHAW
jgi:hypothetical protein